MDSARSNFWYLRVSLNMRWNLMSGKVSGSLLVAFAILQICIKGSSPASQYKKCQNQAWDSSSARCPCHKHGSAMRKNPGKLSQARLKVQWPAGHRDAVLTRILCLRGGNQEEPKPFATEVQHDSAVASPPSVTLEDADDQYQQNGSNSSTLQSITKRTRGRRSVVKPKIFGPKNHVGRPRRNKHTPMGGKSKELGLKIGHNITFTVSSRHLPTF